MWQLRRSTASCTNHTMCAPEMMQTCEARRFSMGEGDAKLKKEVKEEKSRFFLKYSLDFPKKVEDV